jgi:hypothetical protein
MSGLYFFQLCIIGSGDCDPFRGSGKARVSKIFIQVADFAIIFVTKIII